MGNAYRSTLAETVAPILPTGNAQPADVLSGKTFSNADGTDKVGTMPNNGTVNPTALNPGGSYTVPQGYHSGSGQVKANANTGTYTASSRGAALDMGASNLNRYVNTNGVPNSNSGTYTYPANDTGGTKDLGQTNTYRYVNATNVYNKGKADGTSTYTLCGTSGTTKTGNPGFKPKTLMLCCNYNSGVSLFTIFYNSYLAANKQITGGFFSTEGTGYIGGVNGDTASITVAGVLFTLSLSSSGFSLHTDTAGYTGSGYDWYFVATK